MTQPFPESFQVGLPLWYLLHRGTAEVNAPSDPVSMGVSIGHILIKLRWGDKTALALFTDERRAEAFAGATQLAGLLAVRVATTPQFYELLTRLTPDTTHVGFDPSPPGTPRGTAPVVPVADIVKTLRDAGATH